MNKMLLYFFIISLSLIFYSCSKKSNSSCYQENPLEEIAWLKAKKFQFDMDMSPQIEKIIEYQYQNSTYFLIDICSGCTDAPTTIYHCDGTIYCEYGGFSGKNTCSEDFLKNKVLARVWYNQ